MKTKSGAFYLETGDTQLQTFKTKYNDIIIRVADYDKEEDENIVLGIVLNVSQVKELISELQKMIG